LTEPGQAIRPSIWAIGVEPTLCIESANGSAVLVVGDNAVNQLVVTRLLEKQGQLGASRENGREAGSAFEQEPFDLILMGRTEPEMDGLEATALIRERERFRGGSVAILALTAYAMNGDAERCLARA